MIKSFFYFTFYFTFLTLVTACSSKPEKSYQQTAIQSVSYSLLELADKKRQQDKLESALNLYLEAEKYATKRNDKYLLGIAKLKRASVHLKLDNLTMATKLVAEVEQIEKFEPSGLRNSIDFIQAKIAYHSDEQIAAQAIIKNLVSKYANDSEQSFYYLLVSWVYGDSNISTSKAIDVFSKIAELKQTKELNNIEIYSYGVFQLAKVLNKQNKPEAEKYILLAIQHFSSLELSNKVSQCYQLAAEFYRNAEQPEKVSYFLQQTNNIDQLDLD